MNQRGEIFCTDGQIEETEPNYLKIKNFDEAFRYEQAYGFQGGERHQDFELYNENMDRVKNLLRIWILHYGELIKYVYK